MKRLVILSIALCVMAASVSAQASQFIKSGNSLYWTASTGHHGAMKVVVADGQYCEVEQTNDVNKAAGVQKLYGAILDNGQKIVLMNVGNWKEVWEGSVSGSGISGNISASVGHFTFTISSQAPAAPVVPMAVSTAPFLAGKTLKWSTNAMGGQNGTLYVSSVSGTTFTLDQKNDKNVAAGVTKLDGEVKDGKVYIYNRKWNETWAGANANGVVSGKINNQYTFQINE